MLCSEEKYGIYCRECPVNSCKKRLNDYEGNNVNLSCDGNCYFCDGAISSTISTSHLNLELLRCPMYDYQKKQIVEFISMKKFLFEDSKIELYINKIKECASCNYDKNCKKISSKQKRFNPKDIKSYLKITWRYGNEKITQSIAKEKAFTFLFCNPDIPYVTESIANTIEKMLHQE